MSLCLLPKQVTAFQEPMLTDLKPYKSITWNSVFICIKSMPYKYSTKPNLGPISFRKTIIILITLNE